MVLLVQAGVEVGVTGLMARVWSGKTASVLYF